MEYNRKRASEVFGNRLRETRRARGLSQTELAERLTDRGRPMSKAAVLRIEKGTRGLTLDEAIALAAELYAVPANMLTPPEGSLVELTANQAVDGEAMRYWFLTGNPLLAWPEPARDEDRATLQAILERALTQHATAMVDAVRVNDQAGIRAAAKAMQATVDRHREALAQIERTPTNGGEDDAS